MLSCSACEETKDASEFYPGKRMCKVCISADRAAKYRSDPAMRARLIARALKVSQEKYADRRPRNCQRCGRQMKLRSRDGAPGTCSDCKRVLGYKVQVSRAQRVAIYERDNWTCWLCAEVVDATLHPNHRMAATLDHVRPRSLTLFPDDSPENLRLAHRSCNSARGARAA